MSANSSPQSLRRYVITRRPSPYMTLTAVRFSPPHVGQGEGLGSAIWGSKATRRLDTEASGVSPTWRKNTGNNYEKFVVRLAGRKKTYLAALDEAGSSTLRLTSPVAGC